MNTILTAAGYIKNQFKLNGSESYYDKLADNDVYKVMVEFAKLHVEAALKAASEVDPISDIENDDQETWFTFDTEAVLKSYPLENIK